MKTLPILSLFVFGFLLITLHSAAQSPTWAWAHTFGSATVMLDERADGVVVDNSGNVYATGPFGGTIDFDPGAGTQNIISYGNFDVFISKLDASGNYVWSDRIGGPGYEESHAIAFDPSQTNIYVGGHFYQVADFDPGAGSFPMTPVGSPDMFVCKLNAATGNFVWARQFTGSSGSSWGSVYGIATNSAGDIYTTGYFHGTFDFDPGANSSLLTADGNDIFIAKLDAAGNFLWAVKMGGAGDERANSICVEPVSGDVYTTGSFESVADFDPGVSNFYITAAGQRDIFVSKLDASGNFIWAKAMRGTSSEWGNEIRISTAGAGDLVLTGGFYGTVDFDPDAGVYNLVSNGMDDIFVVKLNTSGVMYSAVSIGDISFDEGMSLTIDATDKIFVTGYFTGTVDFNTDWAGVYNLTSTGDSDVFVWKLDPSMGMLWASSAGGIHGESGLSIDVNSSGDAYVGGYYRSGSITFSTTILQNAFPNGYSVSDAFVAKLDHTTNISCVAPFMANTLFPNPANDHCILEGSNVAGKDISIFSIDGKLLQKTKAMSNVFLVHTENFDAGIYLVKIESAEESESLKLVVE